MSTPGPAREERAPGTHIAEAARAAGLDPATLEATLSPEDRADLAAGLLTSAELTAYAESVAARWRAGAILPDERELADAWLRQTTERTTP